jgi:opacity protein-like surface antigen
MARTLGLFLMLAPVTLASAAFAEATPDELRQRDDTIAELVRKVDVLTDEVATLRTQVAVPEETELKSAYGLGPAASKVYGVTRGLSIGGYGEANYINFIGDEENSDLDRSDALRTVIYLGYKFSESIVFNSEIEFEHATTSNVNNGAGSGSVSVEFAALDFFWRPELNARAGLLLVPMGFVNEVHEPPFFYGVQRPETETRILPTTWRENGVGIFGTLGESLEYRSYVLAGFNAQSFTDAGIRAGRQQGNRSLSEDLAWVTRMDWTPDAVPGFLLGGAFYLGDSGQDVEVAGGDVPDSRLWIFEGHAEYQRGPFHARGLFAFSSLSDARELNTVLDRAVDAPIADEMLGGYAEVAYDVYPSLFGSEERQLEPFLRFEYVDTQYDVPDGFEANRDRANWIHGAGVNFYPHPNVVLKIEYRNVNTRGQGERADELGLGMGFAF